MKEEWKDVAGYEGAYMVSNLGRIRRCAGTIQRAKDSYSVASKILKAPARGDGYPMVNLYDDLGNRATWLVHRLIAYAFIGVIPEGRYVHHKDGQRTNNRLDNLEIVTPSQNQQASYDTGTRRAPHGSNHCRARLTEEDVKYIRASCIKYSRTDGCHALARKYGVGTTTIAAVVNGDSWRHVS